MSNSKPLTYAEAVALCKAGVEESEACTPGPWASYDNGSYRSVMAPETNTRSYDDGSKPEAAAVWNREGTDEGTIDGSCEANARLIARSRTDLPALWSLVLAELEAHKQYDPLGGGGICEYCNAGTGWPCATVARMLAVLEGLR